MVAIDGFLEKVRALTPKIVESAGLIERERAVPKDLILKLKEVGVFRMLTSKSLGGEELSPVEVSRVLEELARADASTAWTAMLGAGFNVMLGYFPKSVVDKLFATTPDVFVRGAIAPKGVAVPTKDGYLVKGSWSLGSGSYDYEWVIGNCVVLKDGRPEIGSDGRPEMRLVLVPKKHARFLNTWDAMGLRGTASDDYVIEEVFVPEEYTTNLFGKADSDLPFQRLPLLMKLAPNHASVTLGIAQGTLDDLCALSKSKRPAFGGGKRLSEDPLFNHRLGGLSVRLESLRRALENVLEENWQLALSRAPVSPLDEARTVSLAAYVQTEACAIVGELFTLAGASACYNSSSIGRRLRDIRCATQHVAASTSSYQNLGSLLVGQP